jgi:hypothetical protein
MEPEAGTVAPPSAELPEEQPVLGEERWREIALYLYVQLDNIDTLYDACRGNEHCFYENVAKYHPKRHEVAKTDGCRVIFA